MNAACNKVQKELRTIDNLLKLDPGNMTLVKQKADLLGSSIAKTKDKLQEMEAAQEQVTAQYKNKQIDAGQYRNFQQELIKTKASLQALEAEKKGIVGLGGAFTIVKGKVQQLSAAMQPVIAGAQKIGQISSAAFNVGAKALLAYGSAAASAGLAAIKLTGNAALAADDLNTLSTQTGLSTEALQEMSYAADLIDVPVETVTGSMAKLTKNMASAKDGTGITAEAFAALGVSIKGQNGALRSNQDVFNDAIAALGDMANETERDALAMQIFGKSAQDLNPLIEGGAERLQELGDQAQAAGLIMSQDALNDLNTYNDALDMLKANASASGNILAGAFASGLTDAASALSSALPSLASFVGQLSSGGDISGAQEGLTQTLTSLLAGAVSGLGANLPSMLAGFNVLILSIVDALAQNLTPAIATLLPQLITGLTGLVEGLVAIVPTVLPALLQGAILLFTGIIQGLAEIIPQIIEMLPGLITDICNTLVANLPLLLDATIQIIIAIGAVLIENFPQIVAAIVLGLEQVLLTLGTWFGGLLGNIGMWLGQVVSAVAAGLGSVIVSVGAFVGNMASKAAQAASQFISNIVGGLASLPGRMLEIGSNVVSGIWSGISSGLGWIKDKITGWVGDVLGFIKGLFGIHSPSTVMRDQVGKFLAEGIGVGFVGQMSTVRKKMAEAIPTNFATNITASARAADSRVSGLAAAAGIIVHVTNNSPKAISTAESARLTRNTMRQIALKLGGAPA